MPVDSDQRYEQNILELLTQWRTAWQQQDVNGYLSFYSPEFQPGENLSVEEWQLIRRSRITKPNWLTVDVINPIVTISDDLLSATVQFEQQYKASNYTDRSPKTLLLSYDDEKWAIVAEQSP